jgi:SAM-dependent methyltransferase
MAEMARGFQRCCQSAPWRVLAGRLVLPWALQREVVRGDVLEIGCGSGAMAAAVVRRFPGVRLTATDYDAGMVAATRQRLAGLQPRARVCRADAAALPFDDGSFDVVLTFLMLHHVIRWEAAVAEARRVLRPGGTLLGYDLVLEGAGRVRQGHARGGTRFVRTGELRDVLADVGFSPPTVTRSRALVTTRFCARVPAG